MVKPVIISLLLSIFCASIIFSQDQKIEKKQEELSQIKVEISRLENEIAQNKLLEKKSYTAIENFSKQSFLLNKLINSLRKEEATKQKQISKTQSQISSIEDEIKTLKKNYANYVLAVYKKGPLNEIESIVNAESMQQAAMRVEYLKKFSDKREDDLKELKNMKQDLLTLKTALEKERKEKAELAGMKAAEQKSLKSKLNERNNFLNKIKKDKKALLSSINSKKAAQSQIENLIASLIENAERKKREIENSGKESDPDKITSERNETAGYEIDLNYPSFVSFSDLKGKMIWPLSKGNIIRKFGENRNKALNTITLNYGVDIKVKSDENVRCVADGVVSAIEWVPGYGNVIIITHKGNYRTVYSHLDEIFVNEGEIVKTGSVLAVVSEGLEGKILHFEIWKSRDKQNPEQWLVKK